MKGKTVAFRVIGRMTDAVSTLLNRPGIGARVCHGVKARRGSEAGHNGPPRPVLITSCPGLGEPWSNRAVSDGSVKARETPC